MSRSLRMLMAGLAAASVGPAPQPPGSMEFTSEGLARNPLFAIAGDDRRDIVTGNQPSYGSIVGSVTVDGVRALRTATNGGSGNQLVWPNTGRTFNLGCTYVLLARRNGNGSGSYDMVAGNGSFNNNEDSHGFLMNPSSVLYGAWKTGTTEVSSNNGRAMVTTGLELTVMVFTEFVNGTAQIRLYQDGTLTATRDVTASSHNRSWVMQSMRIGSRGGSAGGGTDVALFALFGSVFTEAVIAQYKADPWRELKAIST